MPKFGKKSLSLYFRTGCRKQLKLYLYDDKERKALGMPDREKRRSGLGELGVAGNKWQNDKTEELAQVFGDDQVYRNPVTDLKKTPEAIQLKGAADTLEQYQFIVEANFEMSPSALTALGLAELRDEHGNPLDASAVRPDLIQVLPSGTFGRVVTPGGQTADLPDNDQRVQLRIIDIKMSAEPGANYFAEVVYYSVALAMWLSDNKLDDKFVVAEAAAVWPGKYADSNLLKSEKEWNKSGHVASSAEKIAALEVDLEKAVFDVFLPRLRTFFASELPIVLVTPWDELPWHVDFKCGGCEFLGYPGWKDRNGQPTNDPEHCWPTGIRQSHLSRVFGLTEGMANALRQTDPHLDVVGLAGKSAADPIYNVHRGLQSKRVVLPERAAALNSGSAGVIPGAGGSAVMPKWTDLRIFMFFDYDLSTALTCAMSLEARWLENVKRGENGEPTVERDRADWHEFKPGIKFSDPTPYTFLVPTKDINEERREFLRFLKKLKDIVDWVRKKDEEQRVAGRRPKKGEHSTYQIYLWDEAQLRHLTRLVGRHLGAIIADDGLKEIAWLFPPPELLQHAEHATRRTPITLVADVVRSHLKTPVPHHYTLSKAWNEYGGQDISLHPLFYEPLSDLVPGERIHEYWNKTANWATTEVRLRETVRKKVNALRKMSGKLGADLKNQLSNQSAPFITAKTKALGNVPPHSQLWYQFVRLDAAVNSLETVTTRNLPPHEREALFKAARLKTRLEGTLREVRVKSINRSCGTNLDPKDPLLLVYELRAESVNVKFKEGDFNLVLSKDNQGGSELLERHVYSFIGEYKDLLELLPDRVAKPMLGGKFISVADSGILDVELKAIDRDAGYVALSLKPGSLIYQLESRGLIDLRRNAIIDATHIDTLTGRIGDTLHVIGYPEVARADSRVYQAMGMKKKVKKTFDAPTPAVDILWKATETAQIPTCRNTAALAKELDAMGVTLDDSQWGALEQALGRRLTLIWGPPGTGKSTTLRAIAVGAVLHAVRIDHPLCLLITANTYNAVDQVLLKLEAEIHPELRQTCQIYKVQSSHRPVDDDVKAAHPDLKVVQVNSANPSQAVFDLREKISKRQGIVIVGTTPQQLHNLATAGLGLYKATKPQKTEAILREWFDVAIIDEASQMDVATSSLIFTKIRPQATCILAGDDLQLPPIHKAEPPLDLEDLVGSVYGFVKNHHGVNPVQLTRNYRSNETIVEFVRHAGYDVLESHRKRLALALDAPLNENKPVGWPATLAWNKEWVTLLDPKYPAVCLVHEDEMSSQLNHFEAETVASLLKLLDGRLCPSAQVSGTVLNAKPYDAEAFWRHGVGIVAPHRAQVSCITEKLHQVFTHHHPQKGLIRSAVDTVERFQGQERDVIIGSFGLGDLDLIRSEEEFLYNLRRFNVMASRAKAKLIVLVSQSVVNHLSNDMDVIRDSRLLKHYVESFCCDPVKSELTHHLNGRLVEKSVLIKRR